ncbi:MAG: outer membrane beta-barrel protein [Sphingomonadaceae bacterium]
MRLSHHLAVFSLSAAILTNPITARAQDAAPPVAESGKRSFKPDFFASFLPVSALDMVERIPGFSINQGDGKRGFGDNAGNVLIDGDRPSTKSDDIFSILSRIPASQVEVIELSEQAGSDGETRGQGQVVNVIRTKSSALSGTYEGNIELGEARGATPFGKASASLERGSTTFELSGGYFAQFNRVSGPEVSRNGSGHITNRRDEDAQSLFTELSVTGAIKTKLSSAKINLNAQVRRETDKDARDAILFGPTGPSTAREELRSRDAAPSLSYEVGGDIELPVTRTVTTKLIGLYRNQRSKGSSQIDTLRPGQPLDRFSTRFDQRPGEIVVRNQTDWVLSKAHAIQFGGEVAINRLAALFDAASSVGGATASFPASNVNVSETRFEPFISDVWTLSSAWKVDGGIIAEASRITVSGDSTAQRSFFFLKPKLSATWTINKQTTIELRALREVAQLDFTDFATAVDLGAGGQVAAGNAELVPERTITLSALIRRKFFDRGSIQLLGSFVKVSETQDLIPVIVRDAQGAITSRFDGSGNIGNSTRWRGELDITLPFDWLTKRLGITGMELKYNAQYQNSRVTDPVTGRSRRRSGIALWQQRFNFRHDIPKAGISWGIDAFASAPNSDFFIDQIRTFRSGAELFAFLEYKKLKIGTLRFQISNVTDVRQTRDRTFFRDTRASGDIIRTLNRERSRDSRFQLSLTGNF